MEKINRPWCIAHRGARDESPENTRSAFQKALSYPIDGIEFDVQMTADGVPVVYHDRSLRRVAGIGKRVSDISFSELQRFDWGRWFHPDYTGEPLLTLEEALVCLKDCRRVLVEIKSRLPEQASGHAYRLAEKVAGILSRPRHSEIRKRCFLLSFDNRVLEAAHQVAPEFRYVYNCPEQTGLPLKLPSGADRYLWAVCVRVSRLTDSFVQRAKRRGLRIFTYTCNGPRQVRKAVRFNVDAVLSDRPGWLTRYLKRT